MEYALKKLGKSTFAFTIEIKPEEMRPYLEKATLNLSKETVIPGFRPGKAPYEQVIARFGAQRVWEEAALTAVPGAYADAVKQEHLETIGAPAIDVIKLAPDNSFIFKATAAVMPGVILGDHSLISIEKKSTEIGEDKVSKVIGDLRKMQTKETVVARPARQQGDKVILDMTMSLDSVPLDGGQTKDHAVYMDEEYYVPGLKEQLAGLKKGDTKEFKLRFSKEHYQRNIAGRDVDFKVTVKDVFGLTPPDLDDAFAQSVGQKTLAVLKSLILTNLKSEAEEKEAQRREIALLNAVVDCAKFSDIPEVLINEEVLKMLRELEEGIARQGQEFTEYLSRIGKTRDQLRLDFAPQAMQRVKIALAVRKIAETETITVSDEEVNAEIRRILDIYKNSPDEHEKIRSPDSREYLRLMLRNRKVIARLKEQIGF